jgi:hypothetical protein
MTDYHHITTDTVQGLHGETWRILDRETGEVLHEQGWPFAMDEHDKRERYEKRLAHRKAQTRLAL